MLSLEISMLLNPDSPGEMGDWRRTFKHEQGSHEQGKERLLFQEQPVSGEAQKTQLPKAVNLAFLASIKIT